MDAAIYEPMTLVGREVRRFLPQSRIPVTDMKFFGDEGSVGSLADYDSEPMVVQRLDADALGFLDILFLCRPSASFHELLARSVGSPKPMVIDLAGDAGGTAPLFVSRVREPEGGSDVSYMGSPDPVSVLLATTLKPLLETFKVHRLDAVAFRPVSEYGEEGIDELYKQTLNLLNMKSVPVDTLKRRVAFDLHPFQGSHGSAPTEGHRIGRELRTLLPGHDWGFELIGFLSPVFYGLGILLGIEGADIPPSAELTKILTGAPNLVVLPPSNPASPGNIEENDGVFVTILETSESHRFLKCWIAADNLRRGRVLNTLEVVENHLISLLPHA